jgi:hypothetical protein
LPGLSLSRLPWWRPLAFPVAVLAVVGMPLGLIWSWVCPVVARLSDGAERVLAGEVAMAGLGIVAGLVAGVIVIVRPGPRPTARLIGSLLGAGLGSLLAWRVGLLAGAPRLAATGVLVFWPLTISTVTVLVTLARTLTSPERY